MLHCVRNLRMTSWKQSGQKWWRMNTRVEICGYLARGKYFEMCLLGDESGTGNHSSARRSQSHPWQASEICFFSVQQKQKLKRRIRFDFIRESAKHQDRELHLHYIKYTMCSSALCSSRRTWQLEKYSENGSWVGEALSEETNKARTLFWGRDGWEEGDQSLQNHDSSDQDSFWMIIDRIAQHDKLGHMMQIRTSAPGDQLKTNKM